MQLTLDEMEMYMHVNSDLGDWCRGVLAVEQEKTLDEIGVDRYLPRGVVDSTIDEGTLVASLVDENGLVFSKNRWVVPPDGPVDMDLTCDLDESAVAFVARAQMEGANAVLFRASLPLAVLDASTTVLAASAPATPVKTVSAPPSGSVVVAIVDGVDRNSVLELLAVAPGPDVYIRNDGVWDEDPGWVSVLSSVQPPAMVKLDDAMIASVTSQVDASTKGQPFVPFVEARDRSKYITSSAYVVALEKETVAALVSSNLALVAVAGREISPKDIKNTERLRRYWLYGKGAAKIRWGTPGSWTRCHRELMKYMPVEMVAGYCTNLSERLGGPGIATHVGTKTKHKVERKLKGK